MRHLLSAIAATFFLIIQSSRAQDAPGLTHSIAIFLAGEPDELLDVPDSEGEGVKACSPWMDSYPVNNGLVFGGVGTSGGYALDDGTSEGPLLEVIACGGVTINADGSQNIVATCYGVNGFADDSWFERPPMLRASVRAGAGKFGSYEDGEFWWVSGGTSEDGVTDLSSSQVYDFSRMEWVEGPELPMAMQGHCKVKLNSTHTMVTGGYSTENQEGRAYIYDWQAATWTALPQMNSGERFLHGCALLGDGRVLVAGGYHGFGQPDPSDLSTAEVFDLTTMSWSETGSLPEGMDGNALLAIERGPWAGQVLHIGGHRPDSITGGDMVNFPGVLRYTPDGIWEEVYQMEHPRAHFVAIPLPLHCNQK